MPPSGTTLAMLTVDTSASTLALSRKTQECSCAYSEMPRVLEMLHRWQMAVHGRVGRVVVELGLGYLPMSVK